MEIDRKELKRQARESMGLTAPRFWVVALVYLLLTTGISDLMLLTPFSGDTGFGSLALFATLFFMLYKLVIDFGLRLWSLWANRRMDPGLGSLVQGFSVAGRVILMELNILARIFLWCIPLSIGATIGVAILSVVSPSSSLAAVLMLAAIYAAVWAIMLRYALAPYLLADHPDDGAGAAVRRSAELMRGWKWELFKLEFSFLGWDLLAFLLSGLVLVLFLGLAGLFQALASVPAAQLPDLISGYVLWENGAALDLFSFTEQQLHIYTIYSSVSNSITTTLCADLAALPLLLWLTPYRFVSRAGFYDARLKLQQEGAPPLPPL